MSNDSKSTVKWALVTGGARRIGAEIGKVLHQRGLNLMVHCHSSRDEADALVAELNAQRSNSAVVLQADLGSREGPVELAGQALAVSPSLQLLVNNASRFYPSPLGEVTPPMWQDLMSSNVKGAFFLSQALITALRSGSIVNLIDIHSERPMPGHTVYCMAKAALEMMTRSMALELAPHTRVNGVSPGAILWPENSAAAAGEKDPAINVEAESGARAQLLAKVAMGRCGTPQEIANTVAFLGLDADYITGQIVAVDGGRSLNL